MTLWKGFPDWRSIHKDLLGERQSEDLSICHEFTDLMSEKPANAGQ
jgi:hypothetical protein